MMVEDGVARLSDKVPSFGKNDNKIVKGNQSRTGNHSISTCGMMRQSLPSSQLLPGTAPGWSGCADEG